MRFVATLAPSLDEAGLRSLEPDLLQAVVVALTSRRAATWVAATFGLDEKFVRWLATEGYWHGRAALLCHQQAQARLADSARRAIAAEGAKQTVAAT